MRKIVVFSIILLLMLAAVGSVTSQTSPNPNRQTHPLHLKSGTFTPSLDAPLAQTSAISTEDANGPRFYIVQFNGPVTDAWKDSVTARGGSIRGYIPDFAFKVRMTADQADAVSRLDHVVWVGEFKPEYRLSPTLTRDNNQIYRVIVETDLTPNRMARLMRNTGVTIINSDNRSYLVQANGAQIDQLARISEVAWIENFAFYEKHNEFGAGVITGANIANGLGYDGSTQTVAVADTGFGTGVASTAHPDVPSSRITAIQDFPASSAANCYNAINDGAADPDSGHGTHTALSVLSDGDANGVGQGTAPAANLVFQSVEDYADMIGVCAFQNPDG
ncbi:MAG: hypothetical protein AAF490_25725, partial [Chloroflexota bacterium]